MATNGSAPGHPVQVSAAPEARASRWLWLLKWLLLIPHYIVLFFLWIAFVVLTIIAFFAILFTARYPRGIFDFNVGVLRWSWRVHYYGYAALGTDRYPPFRLAEDPDYPADLRIAYPERLSRGLVLVKWWLLVIPHYLVLGILLNGGGGWRTWDYDDRGERYANDRGREDSWGGWNGWGWDGWGWDGWGWNGWGWNGWGWNGDGWAADRGGIGLITLLVLLAAIALLFTARYPQGIYDLVLGLDRWVIRVGAYAALMTDEYPPFRLDQGGREPTVPVRESSEP